MILDISGYPSGYPFLTLLWVGPRPDLSGLAVHGSGRLTLVWPGDAGPALANSYILSGLMSLLGLGLSRSGRTLAMAGLGSFRLAHSHPGWVDQDELIFALLSTDLIEPGLQWPGRVLHLDKTDLADSWS